MAANDKSETREWVKYAGYTGFRIRGASTDGSDQVFTPERPLAKVTPAVKQTLLAKRGMRYRDDNGVGTPFDLFVIPKPAEIKAAEQPTA